MYIIGITGPTGAGKTSALQALQAMGALTLDCDEIYHEVLLNNNEMTMEIKARFKGALTKGEIDRNKLGKLVWDDPAALQELNKITHSYISNEVEHRVASFKAQGGFVAAIDAIALIESGQNESCDTVVGVIAPAQARISRIMKRDRITSEQAQSRMCAQQPDSYYKENCDHILENTFETQEEFKQNCTEFFHKLINTATNM